MEVSFASAPPRGWCSNRRLALARVFDRVPKGPVVDPYSEASPRVLHRLVPLRPKAPGFQLGLTRSEERCPRRTVGRPASSVLVAQGVGVRLFGPLLKEPPTGPLPKESPRVRTRRWDQDRPAAPEGAPLAATSTTLKELARRALGSSRKKGSKRGPEGHRRRGRSCGVPKDSVVCVGSVLPKKDRVMARHGNVHRSG